MTYKLTPRPEAVKTIRMARKLSHEQLAESLKCLPSLVAELESSGVELAKGKLLKLADTLSVPVQYLFFKSLKVAQNIPDFRTPENRPAVLSVSALKRIEMAKSITSFMDDKVFSSVPKYTPPKSDSINKESLIYAELKRFYEPKQKTDGTIDCDESFRVLRVNIERSGAIVFCESIKSDSFRGFCFSSKGKMPLIFINTSNQRPATKLFTLMHECVHLIAQETGISDPSVLKSEIEKFCNRMVADVMMPAETFSLKYRDTTKLQPRALATAMARHFGVSKQAAALRITELDLDSTFYKRWKSTLPKTIPPIEEEDEGDSVSGGGGISSQLSRFGYILPSALATAMKENHISPFDAYRVTNLAPDTVRKVAALGSSRFGKIPV